MRPLSTAYHKDVIIYALRIGNFDSLTNLVLSSQKISHYFGVFMQTVKVAYCRGFGHGRLVFSRGCENFNVKPVKIYRYHMISYFIRNLELRTGLFQSDSLFFNNIHRCNNISYLEIFDKVSHSTENVRKLIAIARRVVIRSSKLPEIEALLPHFDVLSIRIENRYFDETEGFTKCIDTESAKILVLLFNQFYEFDLMSRFQEKFQHVKTVYFAWPYQRFSTPEVMELVNDFMSLTNIKNVHLLLCCSCWGTISAVKYTFNELVANLRGVRNDIKFRLHIPTCVHLFGNENYDAAHTSPAGDFIFKPPELHVEQRYHQKITDNIDLSFEVFVHQSLGF